MADWIARSRGGRDDGWRSEQAGLAAMGLVGVTLATFGPFFSITLAYGLLAVSFVAAVCSLWWADRVAHATVVQARARRHARRGQVLGIIALLFILYATGVWVLVLDLFPAFIVLGIVGWSIHRSRIANSGARPGVRT